MYKNYDCRTLDCRRFDYRRQHEMKVGDDNRRRKVGVDCMNDGVR